jgi:FKBP-type peptidyl-prolyl cis-trans isomerase 2
MTDDRHENGPRPDADAPTWTAPALEPVRRDATGEPDAGVDGAVATSKVPGPGKLRVGVVAGAAMALAAGAVATSLAGSPAPSTTSTGANAPAAVAPAIVPFVDEDAGDLDRHGVGGFRDITISAIDGNEVTLKTADGWTRTIAITSSVELTKGGQPIQVSDLAVGDQVRFSQTRNDDGTYTVTAVAVVVPTISGTVKDVTSSGFTVTTRDGSVWTVTTSGDTTYSYGSGTGTKADVVAGVRIRVQGESAGDNKLDALSVRVEAEHAFGTVTAKTADTITIKRRDGSTTTVHVDADTTYRVAGAENADLGDIAVDMAIVVEGRARSDGSIDADAVGAGRLRGDGDGNGRGWGPFRGWGSDKDGDGDKDAEPSASPGAS